ncbi:MAG: alpha/beta hydrolase [Gemmatimonadaceae bacterium]|nr:alpha/beta hydrolase [Gemmatimonadaceae bacterium]
MLASVVGIASACSPLRIAEGIFLGDDFVRNSGVPYGSSARERLDVYRPRVRRGPAPVVIFLHGGRWRNGSKDEYRLLGDALTRRGLVVVVPDYRLFPEAKFPDWVDDAARAVRWTRTNIRRFGGDSSQIWVVGHSSGAHSAALLALDERYLRNVQLPSDAVRGYVSMAGPVDTTWTEPDVQEVMGARDDWPSTYPVNFIDGKERPILFLHGADDRTVSARNSVRLAALIRERGGCARAIVYRGVSHLGLIFALAVPTLGKAPVADDIVAFIHGEDDRKCLAAFTAPGETRSAV